MANTLKRSPKRQLLILDSLREWPTYRVACENAGIDFSTLQRWMRDDPEFATAVHAARDEGGRVLEDELVKRATSGDTTALIFALKSWYRSKYGDKQTLEHTGEGGKPFTIVIEQPKDA